MHILMVQTFPAASQLYILKVRVAYNGRVKPLLTKGFSLVLRRRRSKVVISSSRQVLLLLVEIVMGFWSEPLRRYTQAGTTIANESGDFNLIIELVLKARGVSLICRQL